MNIIEIKDKEVLNNFLKKQKYSQFLHSWEWGEFQVEFGNKIFRLGIEDEGKIIFVITLVKKKIFLNKSYLYAPRFFVTDYNLFNFLFSEIKKIAKIENCIFLRFEPADKFTINQEKKSIIQKTIDIQPSKTLILDITKTEEELLRLMHQKTRYNIRLALKKGIAVKEIRNIDLEFDKFWNLMQETKERDGFYLHAKEYYRKMLNLDFLKLMGAFYGDKLIAINIVSFFGNIATYIHGASSNENRNLMAPYALQWETIKMAKEKNCKYYDFYGIDEKKWPGVTRFKKGFAGEEVKYLGTFDLVFDSLQYKIYKFLRKLRRMI